MDRPGSSPAVLAAIAEEYCEEPDWVAKRRHVAERPAPAPVVVGGSARQPKVQRPLGAYITRDEAIAILAALEAR